MSDSPFRLRSSLDLSLARVGREGEPLLTVERALAEPKRLIDYAADEVEFTPVYSANGGYPGVRAPAPLDYVEQLVRALNPSIIRAFGLHQVKLGRAECSFSMVTLPPGRLTPLQRIPHVDTDDPLQFAMLHYLCGPELGGTAFYRHRATGYENITPERRPRYEEVRHRELAEAMPEAGYIGGDTAHYEQIGKAEAQFDKIIIYRSRLLHSGQIPADLPLDPDPRRGRLTANIFITYRQQ